jgi:phosphoglycerate dehydrogenase-like enzyme
MPNVAVLNDYQRVALSSADWTPVTDLADVTVFDDAMGEAEAIGRLRGFDVLCIMRERLPITRTLIEALPDLRCIVTTGAANRAIDLEAADDHGIVVSGTTNGLGRLATAELTWGLVLAAARHIPLEDRLVREGRWQATVGRTLRGLTLGIIGLGGVGRYIARYATAFDMEVIAWSRNLTEERALESAVTAVGSKEELLERSDVVTIHTVMSPESIGLIDAAAIERMRPGAILINTSRGPIVDEAALVAALQDGRIGGAALDAFDVEPLPAAHPYRALDNVILSPHLGYVTEDVYGEFFTETVRAAAAFLQGSPINVLAGPGAAAVAAPVERRYEDVR